MVQIQIQIRSVKNTHRTGGAKLGRRRPEDETVGLNDGKRPVVFHRVVVCTAIDQYYYQSTNILSILSIYYAIQLLEYAIPPPPAAAAAAPPEPKILAFWC